MWYIGYIAAVNSIAFALFGYDKYRAIRHQWRVPERTLFLAALIGGSLGAYAGMHVFRHKTRHLKFRAGLPVILAVQCALLLWILCGDCL